MTWENWVPNERRKWITKGIEAEVQMCPSQQSTTKWLESRPTWADRGQAVKSSTPQLW